MIKSFLDLEVYKESFQLSIEIEELLKTYPASEKFLLSDQMRRASRSIPAQVAEGYADELIERYTTLGKKLTNLKNNWQNFK